MTGTARFSSDGRHRFILTRRWDQPLPNNGTILYIMKNPSNATAERNDFTISKLVTVSQRLKFEEMQVVNLFPRVASCPELLYGEPVEASTLNDVAIREAVCAADMVVVAWGEPKGPLMNDRIREVEKLLDELGVETWDWGRTKAGWPRHPTRMGYKALMQLQKRNR